MILITCIINKKSNLQEYILQNIINIEFFNKIKKMK